MYSPQSHASPDPIYSHNHIPRVDDVIIINRFFVQETWELMPVTLINCDFQGSVYSISFHAIIVVVFIHIILFTLGKRAKYEKSCIQVFFACYIFVELSSNIK